MPIKPAERERGLIFYEDFRNASSVVENGGTIIGTPVFTGDGVELDGTNDYIKFNIPSNLMNTATISFVIEFTPHFDSTTDVTKYLLDTASGKGFILYKANNASSNELGIYLANTEIAKIASATYGSVWKLNQKNVIAITSTTADTSAWLNGTQILTDDNSSWSKTDPTEIYVGVNVGLGATAKFDGVIHSLKIFNKQLTDTEGLDYSNGGGFWNYENECVLNLPMDLANHDATNVRTLDISGNGEHATFGDGSTPATYPTKRTYENGYYFDGSDYLDVGTGLNFSGDMAISLWVSFERPAATAGDALITKWDATANKRSWGLYIDDNYLAFAISDDGTNFEAEIDNITDIKDFRWHQCIAVFNESANTVSFYVDGKLSSTKTFSTETGAIYNSDALVWIGDEYSGSVGGALLGKIGKLKIWDKALTPLQVADLYNKEKMRLNDL